MMPLRYAYLRDPNSFPDTMLQLRREWEAV